MNKKCAFVFFVAMQFAHVLFNAGFEQHGIHQHGVYVADAAVAWSNKQDQFEEGAFDEAHRKHGCGLTIQD